MKKVILSLVIALGVISCGGNSAKQENTESQQVEQATQVAAISLDSMLAAADTYLDKEVTFKGHVTHTCAHSGRRCFMKGDNKDLSIRVEAKGEIGGFNRELVGSEIAVTGILKERRLTVAEINEMEKVIETKSLKDDGSQESCDTESANIEEMRNWMKANNKDYYSIYFVDGQKYAEL